MWQKLGKMMQSLDEGDENQIPFVSLVKNHIKGEWKKADYDVDFKFKILLRADNNINLPTNHHLSQLEVNYQDYFLIYAALSECNAGSYDIKIKEIIKEEEEVLVRVKTVSPTSKDFGLEIINTPYDLVKVPKHSLVIGERFNFKFINQDNKLLHQEEITIN